MKTTSFTVAAALVLMLFAGCGEKKSPDVIPESEMVDLLTDMQIAQAYYATTPHGAGNPDRETLMQSVLDKHGVTQEQLDSTIAYYGKNMDEYLILYQKVEKNLRRKNNQLEENIIEDDIWPYSRFAAFFPGQLSDGITFSFPADELKPGEALDWRMRLTSTEGVQLSLGIEYENGDASLTKKTASGNFPINLTIISDTAHVAKRIIGTMTAPKGMLPLWADSIRLIKTEFDSLEYPRIRSQKYIYAPAAKPVSKDKAALSDKDSIGGDTTKSSF